MFITLSKPAFMKNHCTKAIYLQWLSSAFKNKSARLLPTDVLQEIVRLSIIYFIYVFIY